MTFSLTTHARSYSYNPLGRLPSSSLASSVEADSQRGMGSKEAASVLDELLKSPIEDGPGVSVLSSAVQQPQAAMLPPQVITNVTTGLQAPQQQQAVLTTINGTALIKSEPQNSLSAPLAVTVGQRFPATRVVSRPVVGSMPVASIPRAAVNPVTRPVAIAPRPAPQNSALAASTSGNTAAQLQSIAVSNSNQMPATATVGQTGGVSTADVPASMMDATKRFLNALVEVAHKQTAEYGKMISDLVRQLLSGRMTVEQFVAGLGESEGVAEILPVLKVGVPLLRHDLHALGRKMMEQPGVQKPTQQSVLVAVSNPSQASVVYQSAIKTEAIMTSPQQTLQNQQVSVAQTQPAMSGTVLVAATTAHSDQQQLQQLVQLQPKVPIQLQQQQLQMQQLQTQQLQNQQLQTQQLQSQQLQPQQIKTQQLQSFVPPVARSATLSPSRQGQSSAAMKRQMVSASSTSPTSTKSTAKGKGKSVASSGRDATTDSGPVRMEDDDITDVTSMAGVNLTEETAHMAASTDLLSGLTRSIKDDTFLSVDCLRQKVNEIGLKYNVEQISPDVYSLLSHAVEERLKTIIERLIAVSQHRLEIHQDESRCEITTDVKSQLKILEKIDRFHVTQRKEREREMLLKAAKSRSKQDDGELALLKERAKQMQQEELEQLQKRAANQTALAAIGQRKRPKTDFTLDGSDGSSPSNAAGGASLRAQTRKTRQRRINLRDLIFILEQDKETRKSIRLYETLLK